MKNTSGKEQAVENGGVVLQAAYQAWMGASGLRQSRERNKNFTYGDQWIDTTTDEQGCRMTDYQRYKQQGCEPITNNMMRQMVKSVVGRFRSQIKDNESREDGLVPIYDNNEMDELDSRSLEEFLISGCCVQRIDGGGQAAYPRVDNVNLHRFFVNALEDVRCSDCEIVGEIHDLSLAKLIMRVARGNRDKAAWIRGIYCDEIDTKIADFTAKIGANNEAGCDFWYARNGKCRAIEVWTLESREVARCHDRKSAELFELPYNDIAEIERTNRERTKSGEPLIEVDWDIVTKWHCRWFSPMGDILAEYDSPMPDGGHPFIMKFYPLTDGEVHSFVEDIIDQQKYINRLVTLIDHIMDTSAKGVLLFPEAALPDGFTWEDILRIWKRANGVLPYSEMCSSSIPQQVVNNGTNIGAYEMLNLQMRLFDQISGVSGVLQGRDASSTTGVSLYDRQIENATVALTDVFETFNSFRNRRDIRLLMF